MVNADTFRKLALDFPGTEEKPHFDRVAFRIAGKRIFATLLEKNNTGNIRLSKDDQESFCSLHRGIYPIDNKWGKQGWTTFDLNNLNTDVVYAALETAYQLSLK